MIMNRPVEKRVLHNPVDLQAFVDDPSWFHPAEPGFAGGVQTRTLGVVRIVYPQPPEPTDEFGNVHRGRRSVLTAPLRFVCKHTHFLDSQYDPPRVMDDGRATGFWEFAIDAGQHWIDDKRLLVTYSAALNAFQWMVVYDLDVQPPSWADMMPTYTETPTLIFERPLPGAPTLAQTVAAGLIRNQAGVVPAQPHMGGRLGIHRDLWGALTHVLPDEAIEAVLGFGNTLYGLLGTTPGDIAYLGTTDWPIDHGD